jgi:septal ring factor EnvC (AmiA/AmiB activator)
MLVLFFGLLAASLFFSGCSKYASDEQVVQLEEQEQAAVAAEADVAELEKQKAELEAQLAEKQSELESVQAEKARIQAQLGE